KESGIGKDELELLAIDLGAEDIKTKEDDVEIYGKPSSLIKIKEGLEKTGIKIESAETELTAKNPFEIRDPKIQEELNKLYEALDDQNDVEEIYSNTAD
ncbi:MAG: putative transcriptional regulatory protein, partial [Candidatus Azambacteria bacterium GW2011_GWD2_46_48]